VTCLLGWFIHRWSREVLGPTGAALALLMFALTPDFLAHGALVTTDAPIAQALDVREGVRGIYLAETEIVASANL
jgi:hypothetical protein